MLTYLRNLVTERDSLTANATGLAEKAAAEDRDLTDTEQASMRSWQERCAELDAQILEFNTQAESQRAYARLRDQLNHDDEPAALSPRRMQTREAALSWGETFIESDAFQSYVGAGTSARVTLPGVLEQRHAQWETRAPIDTGDGIVVPYVFTPPTPTFPSPLLGVCGHVTTGSNAVSWVQWAPNPAPAAPVVAEGAAKPEMALTATPMSDTLDTYAHWKEITRQALEDIPQIRSIVESRLRQGIMRALETGIATALGAAAIPAATVPVGGALVEAIRVGMATVQGNGYTPNAVLVDPADAASIDLGIMAGTMGGPSVNGTLWGLRVVAVPDLPAGTAYVGDFNSAVTVFDRGSTDVYLTDSHADNFIRNILLLLAEIRALVTVPEPQAAAECSVAVAGG
jgi:HK97 family phage major capsid protein